MKTRTRYDATAQELADRLSDLVERAPLTRVDLVSTNELRVYAVQRPPLSMIGSRADVALMHEVALRLVAGE